MAVALTALALSACSSVQGDGTRSYRLSPGIATYDALRAATEQCAAQGGALDHRPSDSTEDLSTYTCRIASPGSEPASVATPGAPVVLAECANEPRATDKGALCTLFQGLPVSGGLDPSTRRERLLRLTFDPGFRAASKDLATALACFQTAGASISQIQQEGDTRLAAVNACFAAGALSGHLEMRIN